MLSLLEHKWPLPASLPHNAIQIFRVRTYQSSPTMSESHKHPVHYTQKHNALLLSVSPCRIDCASYEEIRPLQAELFVTSQAHLEQNVVRNCVH